MARFWQEGGPLDQSRRLDRALQQGVCTLSRMANQPFRAKELPKVRTMCRSVHFP